MQQFFKLISNKYFWLQFLIAIVVLILIMFIVKGSLKKRTRHDKEMLVPLIENVNYEDLLKSNYAKTFNFVIVDSMYNVLYEPGLVISQNPAGGSKVKPGRKVYLTISSASPGEIQMPDLINLSARQAISIIESSGLKFGMMEFVPSFDKNAVLQQKHLGVQIEKGEMITKGSVIDIVVSAGLDKPIMQMPNVLGKSAIEAKHFLRIMSLNIGQEYFSDSYDINEVYVYKTEPAWSNHRIVKLGDAIDLYYTSDKKLVETSKQEALLYADSLNVIEYYDDENFDEEINFGE